MISKLNKWFLIALFSCASSVAFAATEKDAVINGDYDYYGYYTVGYDDDYNNDWFYDYYVYDADLTDDFVDYDYGYYDYDYDADTFDWEEDGLFE